MDSEVRRAMAVYSRNMPRFATSGAQVSFVQGNEGV